MEITYEDFIKVKIHVGTVLSVKNNEKARKPSLILEVDFGKEIGVKTSSAQITHYYNSVNLVGKQISSLQRTCHIQSGLGNILMVDIFI